MRASWQRGSPRCGWHMDEPRWGRVAVALHWLLALMLAGNFGVGVVMADMDFSPTRARLFNAHKWAGVTILVLSALRLAWRLSHRAPAPAPMPAWRRRSAQFAQILMYLLFFAVPLAGWAYSSAAGFPLVWFGVLPLPDFVRADRALAEMLKPLHAALAFALAGVVALHVAAALEHGFIARDGVLRRIWP
jgi:cytochrome b561